MSDDEVLRHIKNRVLSAQTRKAIVACARLGLGEDRDIAGIVAVAKEFGVCPHTVGAAFLFLPALDDARRFVDTTDTGPDAFDTGDLAANEQVTAAFALGRKALGPLGLCPIAVNV